MDNPLSLLSELIAINSVNPALAPDGPGETAIARFVADWCAARDLDVQWLEPVSGRPSVVARARGTGGGRRLMLNAHLDTVGVAGMEAPFAVRREGTRLYGRGALDMKAGLAIAMVVLAAAQAQHLAGDVVLAAVADEEHGSIGTEAVLREWQADACIVTEPTWLHICVAHRGFAVVQVEVAGRAAHTSQPQLGVNAVTAAGRILHQIEQRNQHLQSQTSHPLLGYASLQATLISGGSALFTVPNQCRVTIERRTLPGEQVSEVLTEINNLLIKADLATLGATATTQLLLGRESWSIAPDAPLVQTLLAAMEQQGYKPEFWGAPYWMDSALMGAAGIPTVVFGPSGAGMHASDEWVDIEQVQQCTAIVWNAVQMFCDTRLQPRSE